MNKSTLSFSKEQVTQIIADIKASGESYQSLFQVFLEAMMLAEREEYKLEKGDLSNGYRPRRLLGAKRIIELSVPRTRYGNFYPILLAIFKDQQAEMEQLSFLLYTQGLTTEQIGAVFEQLYANHYSKQSISRLAQGAHQEVLAWLERPLDPYYPLVYIDCIFVPVRGGETVSQEAIYTLLAVKADQKREVLGIVCHPSESAQGWSEVFGKLKERGVQELGLVISDGLVGIEQAVASHFSGVSHQRCVVQLKRRLAKLVKQEDRRKLQDDLGAVFQMDRPEDTPEAGYKRWEGFLEVWGRKYRSIRTMCGKVRYRLYFTYLKYAPAVRRMIYTTNWVERLNRDYKRVLPMRGALPSEESLLVLLGRVGMSRKSYEYKVNQLTKEEKYFRWE